MMPELASNLEFEPKIAMKTTWATNEYPHLGFIPLFPRLSGMFLCLHDINPPSSKYPFSSIRQGDRYGGDPQLLQDWNVLEGKHLAMTIAFRVSPVPGPTLFELQYPLPSSFGYTRLHRYWGVADAILERSRNAFYPLMATISYFLFFLNFPAIQGPLLVYEVASSGALSSKRSPPEMSLGSSKRPHADPVGNCSTGDRFTTMEGNRKEQSSGYEDGFYWQYLLAHSKVPISGITEVTESELLDFSIDYPQAGYLVRDDYLSREVIRIISHRTESVPVWIVLGPKPMPCFKEFNTFFPSPAQIEEARQRNNKGKSVDNGWDDWGDSWNNIVLDDENAAPSGSSQVPSSTANLAKQKMVNGQYVGETQDKFFERQKIKRQAKIAAESPIQRQSREAREEYAKLQICPSNKKRFTAIFKWVENERGEEEQVREWIDKRAWSHEWLLYGDTQHFYHSDCDEWDLCKAFDPQTQPSFIDDNDKFDNDDIPMESREPSPPTPLPAYLSTTT